MSSNSQRRYTRSTITSDLDRFNFEHLRDQIAFEIAMSSFEQKLFDSDVDLSQVLDELVVRDHLFELIFSGKYC